MPRDRCGLTAVVLLLCACAAEPGRRGAVREVTGALPDGWPVADGFDPSPAERELRAAFDRAGELPLRFRPARRMTAGERLQSGDDVLMLIDGVAVRRSTAEQLAHHLAAVAPQRDPGQPDLRPGGELLRTSAVVARHCTPSLQRRLAAVHTALAAGASLAALVADHGSLAGASAEGRVTVRAGGGLGPLIEMRALRLAVGERSPTFATPLGYVVLEAIDVGAGDDRLREVTVTALLVAFDASLADLAFADAVAMRGHCEVVLGDAAAERWLPILYRPRLSSSSSSSAP